MFVPYNTDVLRFKLLFFFRLPPSKKRHGVFLANEAFYSVKKIYFYEIIIQLTGK